MLFALKMLFKSACNSFRYILYDICVSIKTTIHINLGNAELQLRHIAEV